MKALTGKLNKLEAEKVGLEEKLRLLQADTKVKMHPDMLKRFRLDLVDMHNALTGNGLSEERRTRYHVAFRNLIERVVVHPTAKSMTFKVTPYARLSAVVGVDLFPTMRTPAEMLAEQGISNTLLASKVAR